VERLFEASSQDNIIRQIVQADEGEFARIQAWFDEQLQQQLPEKVKQEAEAFYDKTYADVR
jgi:macrodomain Ter protein organizer (MatP/YcbG family)